MTASCPAVPCPGPSSRGLFTPSRALLPASHGRAPNGACGGVPAHRPGCGAQACPSRPRDCPHPAWCRRSLTFLSPQDPWPSWPVSAWPQGWPCWSTAAPKVGTARPGRGLAPARPPRGPREAPASCTLPAHSAGGARPQPPGTCVTAAAGRRPSSGKEGVEPKPPGSESDSPLWEKGPSQSPALGPPRAGAPRGGRAAWGRAPLSCAVAGVVGVSARSPWRGAGRRRRRL